MKEYVDVDPIKQDDLECCFNCSHCVADDYDVFYCHKSLQYEPYGISVDWDMLCINWEKQK